MKTRSILGLSIPGKLDIAGFFLHVGIIAGIVDSMRALHGYLSTPNVPVNTFSFFVTTILIYGFAGYLWSLPVRLPMILARKRGIELSPDFLASRASWLLIPVLLVLIVLALWGWLLLAPSSLFAIIKTFLGIAIIVAYMFLLHKGAMTFFRRIIDGKIALQPIIFTEVVIAIMGYMLIAGFNMGGFIYRLAAAIILAIGSYFLIRSRFSPILNKRTRNVALIAMIVVVIMPLVPIGSAKGNSSGNKTVGGKGNIVVITIDTLRYNYLSFYGSDKTSTPNLDAFSRDAVVFDKMHTVSPWTLTSLASLNTGLYPSVHGGDAQAYMIYKDIPTLAENFRERGYTTAGFTVNPLLGIPSGLGKGFDEYFESYSMTGPYSYLYPALKYHDMVFIPLSMIRKMHYDLHYVKPMEKRLFSWIDRNRDKKSFLWVHYYDPHAPYCPPDRYLKIKNPEGDGSITVADFHLLIEILDGRKRYPEKRVNCLKDLYAGDVEFVDERVGMLMEKLKEAGWLPGATVIITSDHGEEFLDHGSFEHGHTYYEELVHVPLLIHTGSDVEPFPADAKSKPVNMLDLTATIADIGGLKSLPFYRNIQGKSIYEKSSDGDVEEPTFMELTNRGFPDRLAVLKDDWKYMINEDGVIDEIYNLNDDPLERENLLDVVSQDILKTIYSDVENWRNRNEVLKKSLVKSTSAEDEKARLNRKMLQGLGYF